MKVEKILAIIVVTTAVAGGYLYLSADKNSPQVCLAEGKCEGKKSTVIKITSTDEIKSAEDKKKAYDPSPEIISPHGYLNTNDKPITIREHVGKKVVLVDFWTYSCINCQRTLPYLNAWYEKYKDEGLEIIGIHTPEFAFEKLEKNVAKAISEFGVKHPVVLDNDYATWNAFGNQYWPRKYLIDIDGFIVYDHIGEGAYEETEKEIQKALLERKERLNEKMNVTTTIANPENKILVDTNKLGSQETYFGSTRNEYLANGKIGVAGEQTLIIPQKLKTNGLYLGGTWNITSEYAENKGEASIVYKYKAKSVYLVLSSENGIEIEVFLDGKSTKTLKVSEEKLYNIVEGSEYEEHLLEIKIKKGNLKAFAFTFG